LVSRGDAQPVAAPDPLQRGSARLRSKEKALNQKDFEAASRYLGPRYTQHNPVAADGPEGLKAFIQFLRDKFPNSRSEIKRVFADGDYVIVHGRYFGGDRENLVAADIFRFENDKVIEHWDVLQEEVPAAQTVAGNPMFTLR